MQESEPEKLNVSSLQQGESCDDEASEQLAEKIEGELVENPVVLERLLERPQFKAIISHSSFRGPLPPPTML
ncbi:DUF2335 domain-containing protein, partial [Enterobacter cloacae complex sp. OE43NF]|nr:DUF2335 domain-containing protein [Enterobacter cloacae complex sp. OE43NF]